MCSTLAASLVQALRLRHRNKLSGPQYVHAVHSGVQVEVAIDASMAAQAAACFSSVCGYDDLREEDW
jgi:hypothetical protein